MTKRAKTIRNGVLLGVVCIALVAAYLVISANENPAAKGVLYDLGNDHIESVRIQNNYGDYLFDQQDGAWVVESHGVYRTNPEKMKLLLGCLEKFTINRMLTKEKAEYGFETPQASVWVTTGNGKKHAFTVGADAISGSSVYIKSGEDVMLTSTAMTSQLTGSLAAYRAKDVLVVDPAMIRSVEYMVGGQRSLLLKNTGYHDWTMEFPFKAPAREVVLNELVAKLRSLVIAGYVDETSNTGDTGLDTPTASMTLTDENGVTQTLDFGAVQDTIQFVRIGGESDIVQLYADDLDFSALTPEGVMFVAPLDIPVDSVQSVTIRTGGTEDALALDRSGTKIVARLNGETIDYAEGFISIYFKCMTINADGYDINPAEPGIWEATVSVTKTDGETVELALYRRDESTLYLFANGEPVRAGETMFYTDAVSLTELLYRLQGVRK